MIVPAVAKVQRDVHLNRWNGWSWVYLQRPPAHHLSYTLLTAVGRYPNALGLSYEDRAVDEYIIKRTPRPLNEAGRVDAARGLFFEYVRAHPREYVGTLARGAGELGPFLAYTTFMAPKRWSGWPEVVPGVDADPRDVARYGQDQLMNVRARYLRLRPWQWVLFGLALTVVAVHGARCPLGPGPSRRHGRRDNGGRAGLPGLGGRAARAHSSARHGLRICLLVRRAAGRGTRHVVRAASAPHRPITRPCPQAYPLPHREGEQLAQ